MKLFLHCEDRRKLAYNDSTDEEENSTINDQVPKKMKHGKAKLTKTVKSNPPPPSLPRAPLRSTQNIDQRPSRIIQQSQPATPESSLTPPFNGQIQLATPVPSQSLPATPGPSSSQHQLTNISGQFQPATPGSSSIQHQRLNPLTNLISSLPNRQSLPAPESLPDVTGEVFQS